MTALEKTGRPDRARKRSSVLPWQAAFLLIAGGAFLGARAIDDASALKIGLVSWFLVFFAPLFVVTLRGTSRTQRPTTRGDKFIWAGVDLVMPIALAYTAWVLLSIDNVIGWTIAVVLLVLAAAPWMMFYWRTLRPNGLPWRRPSER